MKIRESSPTAKLIVADHDSPPNCQKDFRSPGKDCEQMGNPVNRRNFFSRLSLAFGVIAGTVVAQKAVIEKGKAVVCESDSLKCPNGHDTCPSIDAPLAVGNDSYQNPEVAQLRNYHVLRCDVCHVLFTRE
jgi:hypothetical protein